MLFGTSSALALALQLAGSVAASDAAVKTARGAQARFEITRRAHLPLARSMGGRTCDAVVGRYCYWYDSTETKPVPEPARITNERRSLLFLLDSLGALAPGSDWILGQRVRYTIEGGNPRAALQIACSCGATGWWCAALEGLALHVAEQYAAADSAFTRALARMPDAQRCEWTDLRRMVPATMSREFRGASCAQREAKAEWLWRVSQPLWSFSGNDLRTEHFARHTMALLAARSANPDGMAWSNDSRELLIRYGWSAWFSRTEPPPYQTGSGAIAGHDREPSYFVFPTTSAARARITRSSWALRDGSMPMRYSPRHIEWLGDLAHQLVRLPHGDSLRLLAIVRVRDSALVGDSVAMMLGALQGDAITSARGASVLMLDLANDSMLVSVEAYGTRTHRAERARYSVAALRCEQRCLSDLLLFRSGATDSTVSLESASRRALTSESVPRSEPLGIYWETGGRSSVNASREQAWATVSLEPERVSAARRIATRLRVAPTPTAVRLRWAVMLPGPGFVTLRLPPNARGRYRVRLSIDGVGSSERVVQLQ